MTEVDPSLTGDVPELAPPAPGGEALGDYIQRVIAGDKAFKGFARHARDLGVEVALPGVCRPAWLTLEAVQAYYRAFARLDQNPRSDGFWRLTDHLWIGGNAKSLPFNVRMAQTPNPIVSEAFRTEENRSQSWTSALQAIRRTACRRDSLIAAAFDAIRSGAVTTSGFTPGDHLRQLVPIAGAWWADGQMQCDWTRDELHPWEAATPGRPTFLGIILAAVADSTASKQRAAASVTTLQGEAPPARQPLKADLRSWYQERVRTWPTDSLPPTMDNDWTAARAGPAPSINRDAIRELRAELAPSAWTRRGRKPTPD